MMRILLALVFISIYSCNNNAAEKPAAIKKEVTAPSTAPAPQYFFYPKANVYFDSVSKSYIFLANDGKTWQTSKQIPAAMQLLMDKKVFITSPTNPVWKDNENHKLLYSALLYASPADTQPDKPVTPVIKEEPKPVKKRSGLHRFFDKLFHKKKNLPAS